jgi:hypothetical protein
MGETRTIFQNLTANVIGEGIAETSLPKALDRADRVVNKMMRLMRFLSR